MFGALCQTATSTVRVPTCIYAPFGKFGKFGMSAEIYRENGTENERMQRDFESMPHNTEHAILFAKVICTKCVAYIR